MPDLFEGQDEPGLVDAGLSVADREYLQEAYANELLLAPPIPSCDPSKVGYEKARTSACRYAIRDIKRVDAALRKRGYALKIVPIRAPQKPQGSTKTE